MQLPAPFITLLSSIILAVSSVDARPLKAPRDSGMLTLPMRRIQRDNHIHVELRHQQHINRAERLVARAAGLPGPSDAVLRANLERRASFLTPEAKRGKRFNIPSPELLPRPGLEGTVSNVASQNDVKPNSSGSTSKQSSLAKQSSQIDIDGADTTYVADVLIGTPPRSFAIILDSGSGDFWVQSDDCTSEDGGGCGNHTFLGSDSSSSFVNTKTPWDITYGSGAASGDIVTDTVVFAGMQLKNYTFGIANSISESFSGDTVADGLMGLGKASLSNQNTPTPVQALADAGLINTAITSYRLPRLVDDTNNGEVTFGGLDDSKFDSSTLVTIKTAPNTGFWIIDLGGVSVNGVDVPIAGNNSLMDTGTTLLVVPADDAAAIHAQIPGAKLTNGHYTVPCDTTASVALTFGGKAFTIDPKDLVFAGNGRTSGDCTSGIGAFSDANNNQWLVGDSFLKSVYFSTNADDDTVTLAKAI
ncbi:acid protease [Mycena belliarum]|uniref:Acid protease n=1 Tax=Mycena belliarum TaxID=1033014 RepID=A0AAD6XPZ9_9AGAR|nr:acid protease [Mycena belliae]